MAIEIRPAGEAKSQALAGEIIGKGKAREKFAEDVRISNARTFQAEQQQKAMDWEAQKMQMRSAQEFAQELRLNGARLNAEARAREWEVEKMEMISQADFAQKERVRAERYGQFSDTKSYINYLRQSGELSKEAYDDMDFRNALTYQDDGFKEVSKILGEHDAIERLRKEEERQQKRQEGIEDKQEYGVLPGEFELLSPEQQQQAAMIRTGLNLKLTGKDFEFARIKKIDEITKIMDDFEEKADINPGWGTTIVPLAVRNKDGTLTEATPAQKQLYQAAKLFQAQLLAPIEIPDWVDKDPAEQEKYKKLIRGGMAVEEIKSRLGK